MGPKPLPNVLEIKPYVPGLAAEKGYKLSSNENPLGYSPAVREVLASGLDHMETYPDGGSNLLRSAIAERYGLSADRIVCGAGSDEIFQLLARAYLSAGDEIIQSEHGFLVYQLVAQQSGAKTVSVPDIDMTTDVDGILAAVTEKTKIVFVANPNNPTGTYLPFDEIKRLHAGLPEDVLLVLDAAYAEYVVKNDYASGMEMAGSFENVLMTRTFSKIHGLAALRLGWAYGPAAVIDAINRVRGPFNVSYLAQIAGIAALKDEGFMDKSAEFNKRELARLSEALSNLGLTVFPSVANFILVEFQSSGDYTADKAYAFLRENGLIVRDVKSYNLPDCLRISIGVKEANDQIISVLSQFMAGR
ncbi:histidinol-phosphate transaminase [Ponticaulis sp.]|uniref:histidinol-phosphate transaminase n=1 Tax=Ponticaulis sp. TaxID=2020902 RepID=UPI000B70461B|nr:histidinol-phosphate transaminase [Ponticaulis sp.]MAI89893.1 histidinol-phosphate transaminase [Ponticaulis sp.]OUX99565.1 MAG: histidinol-phosphate transaminase [Hyphomonadaceae bacterium TMED5]|tara:strand:+ start:121553 stop:122632 length:1080 start_codon:yes stop_codon:yes gene_type:complete